MKPKPFNKTRFWLVTIVLTLLYAWLLWDQVGIVNYWVWSFSLSSTADWITAIVSGAILALVSSYALCKTVFAQGVWRFLSPARTMEEKKAWAVRTAVVMIAYILIALGYINSTLAQYWFITPFADLFNIGGLGASLGPVPGTIVMLAVLALISYIIALVLNYIGDCWRRNKMQSISWLLIPFAAIFLLNFTTAYVVGPFYTGATFVASEDTMALCAGQPADITMTATNVGLGNLLRIWNPAYNPVAKTSTTTDAVASGSAPLEGVVIGEDGTLEWKHQLLSSNAMEGRFTAQVCNPGLFFDALCFPIGLDYRIMPC